MGRLRLAATWTLLIVTMACAPATGRMFTVTLPGRELVEPTSVVITDQTGLIVSVEVPQIEMLPENRGNVAALVGDPAVLLVSWTGGMCDHLTELRFERFTTGFRFVEQTDRMGGCRLAGIARTLAVRFSAPLSPELVEFVPDRS